MCSIEKRKPFYSQLNDYKSAFYPSNFFSTQVRNLNKLGKENAVFIVLFSLHFISPRTFIKDSFPRVLYIQKRNGSKPMKKTKYISANWGNIKVKYQERSSLDSLENFNVHFDYNDLARKELEVEKTARPKTQSSMYRPKINTSNTPKTVNFKIRSHLFSATYLD